MRSPKVRQLPRPWPEAVPVLVRLYEEPERPQQALDFIKQYLGASVNVDLEAQQEVPAESSQHI